MSVVVSDTVIYGSIADPAYDGASTISAAITTTTATAISVASAGTFPLTGEFYIQIDSEIMRVTQGAGTTNWTVIRGQLGTTAATHTLGVAVTMPAGGQVDFLSKLDFTDLTSGDTTDYISSSASDTKVQLTLRGRDNSGVIQTEAKTLNGTTAVAGSQAWNRLLTLGLAAGTTATALLTSGGTSLAVSAATNFPATGNYYIQMGKELMQVTGGQGTTTWTITRGALGTTATAHNSGDGIYLLPVGDVAAVDHTKVISSHTAQAGSANTTGTTPALLKMQAGDGVGVALGQIVIIASGTGAGQMRRIVGTSGYGTDFVAVSRDWSVIPDATSVYSVYKGIMLDVAPNPITSAHRFLWNAAADVAGGSQRIFYEKGFVVNNNTVNALLGAQIQIASDTPSLPSGVLLDLALASTLNDTVTWVNRQTAPASGFGSFVTQPALIPVTANGGNLPPGAAPNAAGAQGICLRLTVPAGSQPYNGAADIQIQGGTI